MVAGSPVSQDLGSLASAVAGLAAQSPRARAISHRSWGFWWYRVAVRPVRSAPGVFRLPVFSAFSLLVMLAPASGARALSPSTHRDLARAECVASGLPRRFCDAVASAAYSTDVREWEDMAAHAQIPTGSNPCDAATASAEREQRLGDEIRLELEVLSAGASDDAAERVAVALGRALHTVQDECAHAGMPNAEHAWLSRSDLCDGTRSSPDLQPEAAACASEVTRRLVGSFRAALETRALSFWVLDALQCASAAGDDRRWPNPCSDQVLPGPGQLCDFVLEAHGWDGVDRRWDSAIVGPALDDAFARGLAGDSSSVRVCALDEVMLPPERVAPPVDVSAGPVSCVRLELLCLGKTDEASSFFEDEDSEPLAAIGPGCSAAANGRAGVPSAPVVFALAIGTLARFRRRRARP